MPIWAIQMPRKYYQNNGQYLPETISESLSQCCACHWTYLWAENGFLLAFLCLSLFYLFVSFLLRNWFDCLDGCLGGWLKVWLAMKRLVSLGPNNCVILLEILLDYLYCKLFAVLTELQQFSSSKFKIALQYSRLEMTPLIFTLIKWHLNDSSNLSTYQLNKINEAHTLKHVISSIFLRLVCRSHHNKTDRNKQTVCRRQVQFRSFNKIKWKKIS